MNLHGDIASAANSRLDEIAEHMCALTAPPPNFTVEDFLEAYVPAHHIGILRDAADIAHARPISLYMTVPHTHVKLSFSSDKYLTPKNLYPQGNDASKKVFAELLRWENAVFEHHKMAAMSLHVFKHIVEACSTHAEVRYMWPAVVHLAPASVAYPRVQNFFNKVAEFKPVKSWPSVPPEIKRAMAETKEWLTTFKLVENETPPEPTLPGMAATLGFPRMAFGNAELYVAGYSI